MRPTRWMLVSAAFALLGAASASGVELAGSWYVLVHYRDGGSGDPEQERWEDKVWVFEQRVGRLRWIEYPIAVFEDETGRFERNAAGRYARIPHFWEPDAGQRADIADGLRVNSRGSKHKTLRRSPEQGWSSERTSAAASASVLVYSEVWRIDGLPDLPVFSQTDFLFGASGEGVESLTRHTTSAVREGGEVVVGAFERNGTRRGTFRMMRCGAVAALTGRGAQIDPAAPRAAPSELPP